MRIIRGATRLSGALRHGAFVLWTLFFISCSSAPASMRANEGEGADLALSTPAKEAAADGDAPEAMGAEEAALRLKIVESALDLVGSKANSTKLVNGKKFCLDCSGTVRAAYWGAGVALDGDPARAGGNGVAVLWYNSEKFGEVLKTGGEPSVGDIIFWDNTWDRNGNKKFGDDPLTHVGVIISIDDDGTITYLHTDYLKGVVTEVMTLDTPSVYRDETGRKINSAMYMASYPGNPANPPLWTAAELFRGLADAREIAARWPQ